MITWILNKYEMDKGIEDVNPGQTIYWVTELNSIMK
jgi:hypothetical protein